MEGFIRRIWGTYEADKVASVQKEVYLVRFNRLENTDKFLNEEHPFFDRKLVIMKSCSADMDVRKEEGKSIPIWGPITFGFQVLGYVLFGENLECYWSFGEG